MAALLAILYGFASYAVFAATFAYTVAFLGNFPFSKTIDSGAGPLGLEAMLIDVALLGVFAVQHSLMARQGFKRMWTRIVPQPVERSTYVLFSTAALALILWQWRPIEGVVWSAHDPIGAGALLVAFGLGWAVVLSSTFMIDHFELFGLRQVVLFARGLPERPIQFKTPGLYRYVRHPLLFGFLICFWAAPVMTVGHLLFALGGTGYILIGVAFEERDLVRMFGEAYRTYRRRVPMLIPGLIRTRMGRPGRR